MKKNGSQRTEKLSVILICQDVENRIRACLESVKWADEIVVVDSGSSDRTLEIAREYTSRVYSNTEWPGFGPQKRVAESKASNDWVFSIDADEVVSPELRQAIESALRDPDPKRVFRVNRLTKFGRRMIRHSGWFPDRIVRLYNRTRYHFNDALVHESVQCRDAEIVDLSGVLFHYTFDSLEDYMVKRNRYALEWAEGRYRAGKKARLTDILLRPVLAFVRHYFIRRGFLDGYEGFLIAVIQMQYTFNKYNYLKYMRMGNE